MSTPVPPRRKWLRFSLRTLLLFVLLIGSSATLWWNWGPWELAYTIIENGGVHNAFFTDDDRYIVIVCMMEPNQTPSKKYQQVIDIRDADSGKTHLALRIDIKDSFPDVEAFQHGNYLNLWNWGGSLQAQPVFRIDTGERVPLAASFAEGDPHINFYEHYALLYTDSRIILAQLPAFNPVITIDGKRWPDLSASEEFLAVGNNDRNQIEVISIKTKRPINVLKFNDLPQESTRSFQFIGDAPNPILSVSEYKNGKARNVFFNALNGTQLQTFNGYLHSNSSNRFVLGPENQNSNEFRFGTLDQPHELVPVSCSDFISPTGELLLNEGINGDFCRMYDGFNGKLLWEAPGFSATPSHSGTYVLVHTPDYTTHKILNARTGRSIFEFSKRRWSSILLDGMEANAAYRSDAIVTFHRANAREFPSDEREREIAVWKLRRPLAWYGPAWLPEFWLTLVLGAGFLWSVWRDRRLGMRR